MRQLPFRQGGALVLALAVGLTAVLALAGVWLLRGDEASAAGINLVITKTASPLETTGVVTTGTITYTLTVTNTGDTATPDVVAIRDDMSGFQINPVVTEGAGVTCSDETLPIIQCATDAAMGVGESRTVTIAATVNVASGYVYNGAYVDPGNLITETNEDDDDADYDCSAVGEGPGHAPSAEPDNFDCTRHGVAMPDLTMSKTAVPAEGATVLLGSTITYTLTATNTGNAAAAPVAIRDILSTGLTYFSAAGTGVTCTSAPPQINCTVASIAAGGSATVTVVATVAASSGPVLNGAYIDPAGAIIEINEDDDDPLVCGPVGEGTGHSPSAEPDNFACTSHTAGGLPDLTITKTASPAEGTGAKTGDTITYTLTVSNASGATATATNVLIRDTLGTGLTYVSATGTNATCTHPSAQQIDCTAASLAPGATASVVITATVSATSGSVLNGARVDPLGAITETNEDADDPDYDCSAVGEGSDAGDATEPDNFDCTRHTLTAATPTPTPTTSAGVMLYCPLSGKWAMSVWDGPSGKATADALNTCTGVTIVAAYSLDRTTNTWLKYFPGRGTDINDLLSLSSMQAIITLGQ